MIFMFYSEVLLLFYFFHLVFDFVSLTCISYIGGSHLVGTIPLRIQCYYHTPDTLGTLPDIAANARPLRA